MTRIRSPIKWFGGKSWLIKKIISYIPLHCDVFIEGFCGGAWVTLNLPQNRFKNIICNDANKMLINFWDILRNNRHELHDILEFRLDSQDFFEKCEDILNSHNAADPVTQAAAFFYINTHSYSGLHRGFHGLNYISGSMNQKAFLSKLELFDDIWKRIKHVMFKCTDIINLLKSGDRDNAFIFLDPPYFNGGALYEEIHGGIPWGDDDFIRLRDRVWEMENASILITIDEGEFFMKDGWYLEEVEKTIRLSAKAEVGRETIVTNFEPSQHQLVECSDLWDF